MIERILREEISFGIFNSLLKIPRKRFDKCFANSIGKEIQSMIFHAIKHSICDAEPDKTFYEYKISITVEKSDLFKRYRGEHLE